MNYTEDIDDFSDSIFSEDPLDNVEGDEEQVNEASDEELLKLAKKITNYGTIYIPVKLLAAKLVDRTGASTEQALKAAKQIFKYDIKESGEEKVFVRNMTTGNSYYINKSHFDKNKHELVDDSQQSSTDTQVTSLAFEIADLKKQKASLEQSAKKYKSIYDNAMRAVDAPYTNYEEIQQNRKKAEQADAYYALALDKLKSINAELYKKQSAYNKIGEQQ